MRDFSQRHSITHGAVDPLTHVFIDAYAHIDLPGFSSAEDALALLEQNGIRKAKRWSSMGWQRLLWGSEYQVLFWRNERVLQAQNWLDELGIQLSEAEGRGEGKPSAAFWIMT